MFEDFILEIQSDEQAVLAAMALWALQEEDRIWKENFNEVEEA